MSEKDFNNLRNFIKTLYGRYSNDLRYCVDVAISNTEQLGKQFFNEHFLMFGLSKDELIEEILKKI